MERYFKRKASCAAEDEINWDEEIQYDPGLRKEIDSYHPNLREKVRRKYLENGPCQPRGINLVVCLLQKFRGTLLNVLQMRLYNLSLKNLGVMCFAC